MRRMLTACLLAVLASGAFAQNAPATLEASLKVLEKLLTRHGSRAVAGHIRTFDAKDFKGCRITYELTPQMPPDHDGYVPFAERITVDLSSLDPASVKVRDVRGGAAVSFRPLAAGKGIEYRLGRPSAPFGEARAMPSLSLFLTDKAAAEEVGAALARAVELCRP